MLAQALGFLALPLLTRLYTPNDFSLLALYTSTLSILATIASGRYNLAISLPKADRDGLALLCVALLMTIASTILISIIIAIFYTNLANFILQFEPHQVSAVSYLWMLPLGVLMYSLYDALQYWTSRKRRFYVITRTRVARAVGGVSTQAACGVFASGPFGLIFGHLVSGCLGIIGLARNLFASDRAGLSLLSWRLIIRQAHKFRHFPQLSVPEALLNVASSQLPILIIGYSLPGPEAGQIMLAMMVIGAPMALIGSSASQVYLAEAPERMRQGTLLIFTRDTMLTLFKYSAPGLVTLGAAAPFTFSFIFGQEWERAGWLVLWMTPWYIIQFVTSPLSTILVVKNHLQLSVVIQVAGIIIRLGAIMLAIWVQPNFLAEYYALSGAVFYGLFFIVVYRVSGRDKKKRSHHG